MRKLTTIVITFVLCSLYSCTSLTPGPAKADSAKRLTYIDLVNRLTDLERLATLPADGENCAQWSSYDRASRYDETSDKYVSWGANGDGTGIIRKEGDVSVIAEMKGPGCIWRIWSAFASDGHVKIYLDGQQQPTIDMPFSHYFDGKHPPFDYPALSYNLPTSDTVWGNGRNLYLPIPYQKSCKITADEGWGRYYHINYTTYPKGTILPTFKSQLCPAEKAALHRANEILSNCGSDHAGERRGQVTRKKTITVQPGQCADVLTLTGLRAITALKVSMDFDNRQDQMQALRKLALQITWDDEKAPAVWSPLGDFFGTAPGVNKYKSLPLGMTDKGFYSFWYMPFAKCAKIKIINEGQKKRNLKFCITHAPLSRPIEQLGRFHVKWHRDAFLPTRKDRSPDWTMLTTTGRGRYCGAMLHVWNPSGRWWGEGDEKIFVDGEKFPSTFGTGSEDYFGYAWGSPEHFSRPYHCQTFNLSQHLRNKSRQHASLNRWHITDNIPFQKSFEAAIEKYRPNEKNTLYACTAYWYLAPDGVDAYEPVPVQQQFGYWRPLPIFKVQGVLEAEEMKILSITAGRTGLQDMTGRRDNWSGNAQLWWRGAKPGDKLLLALPAEKTAKHLVKAKFTKSHNYCIAQLYINNKKIGEPIDFYNERTIISELMNLGVHKLNKGGNSLMVEITGANPKMDGEHTFGIDYLMLQEIK